MRTTRSIFSIVSFTVITGVFLSGCDQSPQTKQNGGGSVSASGGSTPAQPSTDDLNALRSMVKSDDKPSSAATLPPGHPPISGGDSSAVAPPPPSGSAGELKFDPPMDWKPIAPRSSMRKAQYVLPRAEGDPEDGELLVFYFGPGEGGRTADNLARWRGQFTQPDGTPLPETAGSEMKFDVGSFHVTLLDVSGRYAPGAMPGMPDPGPRDNFRMFAAVIETPGGPWFVKATGPAQTMAAQREAVLEFLRTAK